MKKIVLLNTIVFVFAGSALASTPRDTVRRKYIGFDANPLLSQVLPFNRIALDAGVFSITTRNYWGSNGIRLSYGAALAENLDVQFLQFMIGYDHRRAISKRWWYNTGVDMVFRFLSEDNVNGNITLGNTSGIGWGGHWGVEYSMSKVVSLSTEANLQLMVLTNNGLVAFILQPPINLTAHFNISKQ
jgi:hypothetical protein